MKNRQGFTLIELLVVIAIIAILAVLVVVSLNGAQVKAKNSSAKSDVSEMGKSIEAWKTSQESGGVIVGASNEYVDTGISLSTIDGTAAWGPFDGTANSATGYPILITKVVASGYTYRYTTDAAGSTYCIDTNVRNVATMSDKGFAVESGLSKDGTAADDTGSNVFAHNQNGVCAN